MNEKEKRETPSFWRTIFDGFIEHQKDGLRFARAGAIIGALIGAGLGVYGFEHFGLPGVGLGLIAGAIIGGVGLWLMYQLA